MFWTVYYLLIFEQTKFVVHKRESFPLVIYLFILNNSLLISSSKDISDNSWVLLNIAERYQLIHWNAQVYHYRVSKNVTGVHISPDKPFPTIVDLISYHSKNSDGLVHALRVSFALMITK